MRRVEEFFQPNLPWWVKKNQTQPITGVQPNPRDSRGLGWVGLDPWIGQFFF